MEETLSSTEKLKEKFSFKTNISDLAKKVIDEKEAKGSTEPIKIRGISMGKLLKMSSNVMIEVNSVRENNVKLNAEEEKQIIRLQEIEDDIVSGNLYTQEDYDRIYYESPLVKLLKKTETTNELYELAEAIVGPQKK